MYMYILEITIIQVYLRSDLLYITRRDLGGRNPLWF